MQHWSSFSTFFLGSCVHVQVRVMEGKVERMQNDNGEMLAALEEAERRAKASAAELEAAQERNLDQQAQIATMESQLRELEVSDGFLMGEQGRLECFKLCGGQHGVVGVGGRGAALWWVLMCVCVSSVCRLLWLMLRVFLFLHQMTKTRFGADVERLTRLLAAAEDALAFEKNEVTRLYASLQVMK